MEIPNYQLDAFTSQQFGGNPAAVCPLPSWLPDEVLQAIAAENNLSETAYLMKSGDTYDLRWFTPATEVDLCGHATLASAYVVCRYLEEDRREVRFNTASGPLTVKRDNGSYTMDFPARPPQPIVLDSAIVAALGQEPEAFLASDKAMAVFNEEVSVHAFQPDLDAIAALPYDGLIVTAPGNDCDFVSRYFAPAAGIPEDPVTGSAHCVLAPYWAERLGKEKLFARQVSSRGGVLWLELAGERVKITGEVTPYLEGRIFIE
jgi:PhzF family phenazine biosynthesis protein